MVVIEDAGHFLHLEKPVEVNNHILTWVTKPGSIRSLGSHP